MFGFERHGFANMWDEMNRLQRAFDGRAAYRNACGVFPPLNVYDDGEAYVVRAEIPGVLPQDIGIEATANTLILKGERKRDEGPEGRSYHRRERDHGVFNRTLELPAPIDPDKVRAKYENGVLEVVLVKSEAARPRQISIA